MNKTLLIFAMPGTGKTTIVKAINNNLSPIKRLAVDFDYTAPRAAKFNASWCKIRKAQTDIINTYPDLGVKLITAFPDAVILKDVDRSKIQIVWLLPQDDPVYLVDRCDQRSLMRLGHLTSFDIEYRKCRFEWTQKWWNTFKMSQRSDDSVIAFNANTISYLPTHLLALLVRGEHYDI